MAGPSDIESGPARHYDTRPAPEVIGPAQTPGGTKKIENSRTRQPGSWEYGRHSNDQDLLNGSQSDPRRRFAAGPRPASRVRGACGRIRVRRAGRAPWPAGPRRLPARARRPPGRGRRVPGDVPGTGEKGAVSPAAGAARQLAVRRGPSMRPAGALRPSREGATDVGPARPGLAGRRLVGRPPGPR